MQNNYILGIGVVLVLVFGGFLLMNNKSEAPTVEEMAVYNTPATVPVVTENNASLGVTVSQVKEFTITGKNFSFSPNSINVNKGDKVKITFINSEGFHDFVVDEFGVATKQTKSPTTEVLEFTADKKGSFEYYCSIGSHRSMGMKGTLIVK